LLIKDKKLAFLDVETTGLSPLCGDRICEVAILSCNGGEIEHEFSSLINPRIPVSPGAYAVNRISENMLRRAPLFSELATDILKLLKDRVIVCHNAGFDLGFLEHELARIDMELPQISVVDTLSLARRYFNFSSNSLSHIAACLGISLKESHRALSDTRTMHKVLINFMQDLPNKGVNRLDEIFINWNTKKENRRPEIKRRVR
jgi:DNA polymerase III epsilon subunit family exonuclease